MEQHREWGSKDKTDLTEGQLEVLSSILTTVLRETKGLIHTHVLGDDEHSCLVAATLIFKFERFPGDERPFTGIASMPDNEEVAVNLVEFAAEAMRDMRGK